MGSPGALRPRGCSHSATTGNKGYDEDSGYRGSAKDKKQRPGRFSARATQAISQRALGAYIQDVWTDPPPYIDSFTTLTDAPPSDPPVRPHVVQYYQNWEQDFRKYFDGAKMDAAGNKGAIPMVLLGLRETPLRAPTSPSMRSRTYTFTRSSMATSGIGRTLPRPGGSRCTCASTTR